MTAAANTPSSRAAADAEVARVVDMLDRLAAADVALTITGLEDLLARLREAEAARELLVDVDRNTLKAALLLRRQRAAGGPRR
jgi:hypothetical protein